MLSFDRHEKSYGCAKMAVFARKLQKIFADGFPERWMAVLRRGGRTRPQRSSGGVLESLPGLLFNCRLISGSFCGGSTFISMIAISIFLDSARPKYAHQPSFSAPARRLRRRSPLPTSVIGRQARGVLLTRPRRPYEGLPGSILTPKRPLTALSVARRQ